MAQMQRGQLFRVVSAGGSPDTFLIEAGQLELLRLWIGNKSASPRYVKLYDKATAPVVATDTPIATITVPGATAGVLTVIDFGQHPEIAAGFANGIGLVISTGAADTDAGAPSANEVTVAGMLR